ncbi:hypothetical protein MIMGU_mgv1a018218mg [Erythranthe guttata]|uniref:Amino acid transporter transmembrane domain-containing protein n=1 Tax=Erythranthe guttata TaxID=4155 RepID=A0A022Q0S3_ERYGU|nr:hypothetical protein MIMGU_mgv1a018218mg [Erythranthe guttata]
MQSDITAPLIIENEFPDVEKAKGVDHISLNYLNGRTSFFKTTFNGLNALSGVGILSVPYALSSGGWLSLILLFILASATFYTGLLITKCMEIDPNIRTYPDIGDKAFGKTGRLIVSIFTNLELYLVATGFLILAGDNLHNLLLNLNIDIYGVSISGKQCFILLCALIVTPTVWINNMTTLSYVSATGVLASVVVLGSVLWSGISDVGFHHKGEILNWNGLPTSFSLYAFCYCAHPVLLVCFVFCTVTYTTMAILGYMMFGSELQSQITLNLPTDKLSSKMAIYTVLINPIAKYALMLKPIVDAIESLSFVVALSLPFFGVLMSLVGVFFSVTASILLPCVCYLKNSRTYRKPSFEAAGIVFVVLMGITIFVIGTYTSLLQIIQNI